MTISNAEKARRATAAAARAAAKNTASKNAPATAPSTEKVAAPAIKDNAGQKLGGRTVVVACKMPRGLMLQLTQFINQDTRVMGGGVEKRQVPMRVGDQVRLKPAILPFGAIPNYPIVCGFSLTRDIDANFWREYAEQNKNLTMITEGLLAAFDTEADANAYCREYEAKRTGFEPLAHRGDPRVEQTFNPNVSNIDIDTDQPTAQRVA
jgi:hypothetical protein